MKGEIVASHGMFTVISRERFVSRRWVTDGKEVPLASSRLTPAWSLNFLGS